MCVLVCVSDRPEMKGGQTACSLHPLTFLIGRKLTNSRSFHRLAHLSTIQYHSTVAHYPVTQWKACRTVYPEWVRNLFPLPCSRPQACRHGHVQHLEHLLFYGADMSGQNASGNTALHVCALYNQVTPLCVCCGRERERERERERGCPYVCVCVCKVCPCEFEVL